jgi:hypothetical protein
MEFGQTANAASNHANPTSAAEWMEKISSQLKQGAEASFNLEAPHFTSFGNPGATQTQQVQPPENRDNGDSPLPPGVDDASDQQRMQVEDEDVESDHRPADE